MTAIADNPAGKAGRQLLLTRQLISGRKLIVQVMHARGLVASAQLMGAQGRTAFAKSRRRTDIRFWARMAIQGMIFLNLLLFLLLLQG